jgi:TolA-binding protein
MLNEYEAARTDAQEALKLLQKEQSSLQADAMYLLAEIESTHGEMERALQLLRTILERFPKTDAAILARRKLQLLMVAK